MTRPAISPHLLRASALSRPRVKPKGFGSVDETPTENWMRLRRLVGSRRPQSEKSPRMSDRITGSESGA